MAKLVFGCGYLGRRVSERWLAGGDEVFAVTRSPERAREFRDQGLQPIVADVTRPETLAGLPPVATVLFAVGFDRNSGHSIQEVYVAGLRNVLAALPLSYSRFIYISSTGVYGQTAGQRVDEDSPCQPTRDGGKACLAAEETLAGHVAGGTAMILRMAGIYGPGRVPRLREMKAGEPIAAASDGYLNLIHVDDAADIVVGVESLEPPRLYNVSDGHPVTRRVYYEEVARLLGAPTPRFQPLSPESHAAQRASSAKRVDNARLLSDLSPPFRFPSYREGLSAIAALPNWGAPGRGA